MMTISKSEMLAQIVESGERPFKIVFVKATGKDAGKLTEKTCYYGAPNPTDRTAAKVTPINARQKRKRFLDSNSIPMTEFSTRKLLTPFISHIVKFNGKQVIH